MLKVQGTRATNDKAAPLVYLHFVLTLPVFIC